MAENNKRPEKKYTVHSFVVVRIETEVEAESQVNAIERVRNDIDYHELIDTDCRTYAEEVLEYLVDEEGDEKYERSKWYEERHGVIVEGRTGQ